MHATSLAIHGSTPLTRVRPMAAAVEAPSVGWIERACVGWVVVGWITLLAGLTVHALERRYTVGPLPGVAPIDIQALFFDTRPVSLTVTAGSVKVPHVATRDAVRSEVTLWRRMHVEDWNAVPPSLRAEAFDAMLTRYSGVLTNPCTWDRMGPADWDDVPQPIRAMAFRHMAEYWSGYYQVGARYGIPRRTMADVLSALLMSESWFEHRAVNATRRGNRDLGLAQASDATRRRMTWLHQAGIVDVLFEDADYFDPWKATRFIALWVDLLLDEVHGDVDLMVAAYHRGSAYARDRRGQEYLAGVKRRLERFVRNDRAPDAWADLWQRDAQVSAQARPWLSGNGMLPPASGHAQPATAPPASSTIIERGM